MGNYEKRESSAALTVLDKSIAMVMGPTPPGFGVIQEAIFLFHQNQHLQQS
ncbi:hypothetical protein kam1_876 [Methylacidiphilum kamchatkense Kam1]|uniref:Uncharacterized protein n=1 Tax=Methylacidiphilum kamchatkense Kam1 TaxID=1202785 RepID=A0A516TLL8_9BACT|nr:hypothetical protein kam1_876 [Methylacidiphilum kamchatkense Kam1]